MFQIFEPFFSLKNTLPGNTSRQAEIVSWTLRLHQEIWLQSAKFVCPRSQRYVGYVNPNKYLNSAECSFKVVVVDVHLYTYLLLHYISVVNAGTRLSRTSLRNRNFIDPVFEYYKISRSSFFLVQKDVKIIITMSFKVALFSCPWKGHGNSKISLEKGTKYPLKKKMFCPASCYTSNFI